MRHFRLSPCDVCDDTKIKHEYSLKVFNTGHVEEVYNEVCTNCGNLLYGFSRPLLSKK